MHPIYDLWGPTGRQLLLPPTTQTNRDHRLAFAHTLCCMAINTTPVTYGCVFGCDNEGNFYGEDGNISDEDSVASANLELQGNDPLDKSIHHFVYMLPRKDGSTDKYSKRIEEFQRELKCRCCNQSDKSASIFRIPIQCAANHNHENESFRKRHRNKKVCCVAMHVGCAMWACNSNNGLLNQRRVFFHPGQVEANGFYTEFSTHVYCSTHAKELVHAPGAQLPSPIPHIVDATPSQSANFATVYVGLNVQDCLKNQNLPRINIPNIPNQVRATHDKNYLDKAWMKPPRHELMMTQIDTAEGKSPNNLKMTVAPQHCLFTTVAHSSPLFPPEITPAKSAASSEQVFPAGNDKADLSSLVSQAFNAIAHKEQTTEDHMEKILQDSQQYWKVKISDSNDFDLFWEKVIEEVSRNLHYNTEPLSMYPVPDTLSWNEVKVIQLGVVPSNL
jgi:hypothetical protein